MPCAISWCSQAPSLFLTTAIELNENDRMVLISEGLVLTASPGSHGRTLPSGSAISKTVLSAGQLVGGLSVVNI